MKLFVLYSSVETSHTTIYDSTPVFWNNDSGWGCLSTATIYTEHDVEVIEWAHLIKLGQCFIELPNLEGS